MLNMQNKHSRNGKRIMSGLLWLIILGVVSAYDDGIFQAMGLTSPTPVTNYIINITDGSNTVAISYVSDAVASVNKTFYFSNFTSPPITYNHIYNCSARVNTSGGWSMLYSNYPCYLGRGRINASMIDNLPESGGSQTPWLQDEYTDGFNLYFDGSCPLNGANQLGGRIQPNGDGGGEGSCNMNTPKGIFQVLGGQFGDTIGSLGGTNLGGSNALMFQAGDVDSDSVMALQPPICLTNGPCFSFINRDNTWQNQVEFRQSQVMFTMNPPQGGGNGLVGFNTAAPNMGLDLNLHDLYYCDGEIGVDCGLDASGNWQTQHVPDIGDSLSGGWSIDSSGEALFAYGGFHIFSDGTFSAVGSDPQWETFYPSHINDTIAHIENSTPSDKRGGGSIYYDTDAKELRFIDQNTNKTYRFMLQEVGDVNLTFTSEANSLPSTEQIVRGLRTQSEAAEAINAPAQTRNQNILNQQTTLRNTLHPIRIQ